MKPQDPRVNPKLAHDIDPEKLRAVAEEAQRKLDQERKEKEAAAFLAAWDRASSKAFKGIFPRPVRQMFLKSALRRMEREQEEA